MMSDTTHEAPERMWIDPDILPSEWYKQYHCDVEYVRIDLVEAAEQQGYASAMEAERKLHEARIEELEAENRLLKTSGIIEVAVRNPSVSEYMQHWEGRAEAAEAKLAELLVVVKRAVRLSLDHSDFKLYAMEPLERAIALAELKGQDDE